MQRALQVGKKALIPNLTDKRWVFWLVFSVLIFGFDQITKVAISRYLLPYQTISVTSFFNLALVYNSGAAFSFLASAGGWQRYFFIILSLGISGFIVFWLRKKGDQPLLATGLSLILGGACGNLCDRLLYGKVVDFLDFYWAHYHWPTFNVADMAITVGATLLIWDSLKHPPTA